MLHCLAGPDEPALPLHAVAPGGLDELSKRLPPGAVAFLSASGFAAKAQEVALLPGGEGGLAGDGSGVFGCVVTHASVRPAWSRMMDMGREVGTLLKSPAAIT